jgi:putative oxidoreductase
MNYVLLLGRLLYSLIFIIAATGHFSRETIQMAADHGFPMASLLVPVSGILLLLGGLSIVLGFKARYGAWLIVIVTVPLTLCMHRFWEVHSSMQMLQKIMFLKNLSMIGGALIIAYFGSGPLSIDKRKGKK